ncbi:MAG TPA: hypothetical protein VFZ97_04955 [Acidimicrobiales bacterium]
MESDGGDSKAKNAIVELTRVQPIEAEVIVARLRASGIEATLGAESVYPSLTVADGVPVFVSARDKVRALAVLEGRDPPE